MKLLFTGAAVAAGLLFCVPAFAQDASMGAGMNSGMSPGAPNLSNTPVQSNDNGSRIMAHNQDVAAANKAQAKSTNTTTAMADKPDFSTQDKASTTDTMDNNNGVVAGKTDGALPH